MTATDTVPQRVLAARTGVALAFGVKGFVVATWFARLPAARDALGLSPGQLGVLLLALSGGSVLALLSSGVLIHRFGPVRTATAGAWLGTAALALAGLSAGVWAAPVPAAIALFVFGYGLGIWDVSLNVEGAAVERRLGRTIMPRFHAAWSLGTVVGAGIGAVCARAGLPIAIHFAVAAAVVLAATLRLVRTFLTGAPEPDRPRSGGVLAAWRDRRTLLVGLLVLVMAFAEGTANDWLAVASVDGYGVGEAAGAVTFGVFVAAMTAGRAFGTVALDRWGRVPVLAGSILVATAGTALTVFGGSWLVALVGVALWGLGAALGFPVGMSAAADDERHAAARVSVVAAIGYTAFLAGPPVVGLLGDQTGTLHALLVVPILLLPALALVPATSRRSCTCHAQIPDLEPDKC
ncbi:MFS transporter [Actinomycetes bacterium KLBMP 9797]